jgi:hypothetical protein
MRWRTLITSAALALCPAAAVPAGDPALRAELETLSRRRVFFGHQSVGVNVMDGLRALASQQGVELRIAEVSTGLPAATFGHAFVGENGRPRTKLHGFARAVDAGAAAGADIALVKFCFVDVKADTDVAALFAEYQATLAQLRARHPGTVFVHVTVPLTTIPGGAAATMKRMMGRAAPELLENVRRDDYNALLRKAYGGKEPLFDLARVEASRPDGTAETLEWQGRHVPSLVPAFSDDGGHLNAEGQRRAARDLVAVLARVQGAATPGARR